MTPVNQNLFAQNITSAAVAELSTSPFSPAQPASLSSTLRNGTINY